MDIYNIQSDLLTRLTRPNNTYGASADRSGRVSFGNLFSNELNTLTSVDLRQYMISAAATDDASQKGALLRLMLQSCLGEPDYSNGVFTLLLSVLGSKESGDGLLSQLGGSYGETNGTGRQVLSLAASRLGDPYSQARAGEGDYTDCSYLTQWCYRQAGIQLPRTAAEQARYCANNGFTITKEELRPGDLVFFSHGDNGRYRNITHVAVYAGDGMIVDASSSNGQVVKRPMIGGQVLYARPKPG